MTAPASGKDNPEEYQQLQDIYLKWHDRRRPLSGFIRELQAVIARSNQQVMQKALRQQADSIADVIAEFGDQVPLVFQIIDEKLNGYGEDYER